MLVDVERAVAESEAERDRARRQHGRAISESGQLSAGPPIKATDQVATALGHDPVLYWRAKQRVGELEVLQLEANERRQNQRFREGHLEALRRALASTTDDGERARLKGSIETVEDGLRRGAEADRYLAKLAPELELVERYLAASSAE